MALSAVVVANSVLAAIRFAEGNGWRSGEWMYACRPEMVKGLDEFDLYVLGEPSRDLASTIREATRRARSVTWR